jgi:hypothetical protein
VTAADFEPANLVFATTGVNCTCSNRCIRVSGIVYPTWITRLPASIMFLFFVIFILYSLYLIHLLIRYAPDWVSVV